MTRFASRISEKAGACMLHPSGNFDAHQVERFSQRLPHKIHDAEIKQPFVLVLLADDSIAVVEQAESLSERECIFSESCRFQGRNHLTQDFIQTRGSVDKLP